MAEQATVSETHVAAIPLDCITPHPGNRLVGGCDPAALQELAISIGTHGVLEPALVRPVDGRPGEYELVAGERRWRASRLAGVHTLPCLVRELDDAALLRVQIIENLQRDDLHPLDECDGFQRLIAKGGYDAGQIASEIGRSRSYVLQRLKLRDLTAEARDALIAGRITAGHAALICRLEDAGQAEALSWVAQGQDLNITVRELRRWIERDLLLDLSTAEFPTDDAELVPAVGACTTCPKRSGFEPELFPEIGSRDLCTDAACYALKVAALVVRRRQELTARGEAFVEAAGQYGYGEQVPESVLWDRWDWKECEEQDAGAKRVLIAFGADAGRVTWGYGFGGAAGETVEERDSWRAREQEDKRRNKAYRKAQEAIWEQLVAALCASFSARTVLSEVELRKLAQCAFMGWEARTALGKTFGVEEGGTPPTAEQLIEQLSGENLLLPALLLATVAHDLKFAVAYRAEESDQLRALATHYGLDVAAIAAAAAAGAGERSS